MAISVLGYDTDLTEHFVAVYVFLGTCYNLCVFGFDSGHTKQTVAISLFLGEIEIIQNTCDHLRVSGFDRDYTKHFWQSLFFWV